MLGLSGGRVNTGNYPDEFGAWFDRHDRRSVAGLVCGGNEASVFDCNMMVDAYGCNHRDFYLGIMCDD